MKKCRLNLVSYSVDSGQKYMILPLLCIFLVDLSASDTLMLLLVAIFKNKFIKNIKAPVEISKFFLKKLGAY